jgi:hypothetical protein
LFSATDKILRAGMNYNTEHTPIVKIDG